MVKKTAVVYKIDADEFDYMLNQYLSSHGVDIDVADEGVNVQLSSAMYNGKSHFSIKIMAQTDDEIVAKEEIEDGE